MVFFAYQVKFISPYMKICLSRSYELTPKDDHLEVTNWRIFTNSPH